MEIMQKKSQPTKGLNPRQMQQHTRTKFNKTRIKRQKHPSERQYHPSTTANYHGTIKSNKINQ